MQLLADPAAEQNPSKEQHVVQPEEVAAGLGGGGHLAHDLLRHEEDFRVGDESGGRGRDDVEGALQVLPGVHAEHLHLPENGRDGVPLRVAELRAGQEAGEVDPEVVGQADDAAAPRHDGHQVRRRRRRVAAASAAVQPLPAPRPGQQVRHLGGDSIALKKGTEKRPKKGIEKGTEKN